MTDPYRIRSAETWALARDDYLAGLNAEAVCRRHDLGLSAFRRRARKHGCRRVDQDDPTPDQTDLSIYGDISPDDQIELARLRFLKALDHGKSTEAVRWRRLWQELRVDNDAFNADFFADKTPAERYALVADMLREQDEDDAACLEPSAPDPEFAPKLGPEPEPEPEPEKVHDVHSNFPRAHFTSASSPPSRAEHRRRTREADRRAADYRRSASTVPTAPPPDTTAPPAMA